MLSNPDIAEVNKVDASEVKQWIDRAPDEKRSLKAFFWYLMQLGVFEMHWQAFKLRKIDSRSFRTIEKIFFEYLRTDHAFRDLLLLNKVHLIMDPRFMSIVQEWARILDDRDSMSYNDAAVRKAESPNRRKPWWDILSPS